MKKDPKSRQILVIDEDPDSMALIQEPLRWEGYEVKGLSSVREANEALNYWKPQLILIDPDLKDHDGVDFIANISNSPSKTSVLVTSKNSNTEYIIQMLDAGASDYIMKPFVPLEFLARVRTHLRIRDLQEELIATNEKLKELVDIDDLTGLYNMRSLYSRLEFEIERARRFDRSVCVVMMDMDHFKSVNDGHDHLFGSFVIAEVGKVIKSTTRNIDIPARYGGDEFLIVLSETPVNGARMFCERLRKAIETSTFTNGVDSIKLTISIGFAMTNSSEQISAKDLVRRADMALYEAKRSGRNQVAEFTPELDRNRKISNDVPLSKKKSAS